MNDVAKAVTQVLQDYQKVEISSFYKDHQNFLKLYDSLIKDGVTQRRESQLKTIQDHGNTPQVSYNAAQ